MFKFSTIIGVGMLLAIGTAQGAVAKSPCNTAYLVTDGIFGRGSMVCTDGQWLDRRASLIMVERAKYCRYMGESGMRPYISRGGQDFDRKVVELGQPAACKMLDNAMTAIEKAAP